MNKKTIITILVAVIILAAGAGFWKWEKDKKIKETKEQEVMKKEEVKEENQNNVDIYKDDNLSKTEIPKGWKVYKNEDFGIELAYPENNYDIDENSGTIHFYYKDGTAPAGSQQPNYINFHISKEKNPNGVKTFNQLFQDVNNEIKNSLNKGNPWSSIALKNKIGNKEFVVIKSYNDGNFYGVYFVTVAGNNQIGISFGGYWNHIGDKEYEMIIKIMESFRVI